MLRILIIGLGRAGAGLHLTVLRRLRALRQHADIFAPGPVIALDPKACGTSFGPDVRIVGSLGEARTLLDPDHTVVHVCTPPTVRLELLNELAELGFRNIVVEKPLTTGRAALAEIQNLVRSRGLRLAVVAPWLASALTARLTDLVHQLTLGALHSIEIHQRKPRMSRSLVNDDHLTAFDIEPPHSVAVCLRLAGAARLVNARLSDMEIGDTIIQNMGSAELLLQHAIVTSRIVSELASPVRERRIELDFEGGHVVGHYPGGEDDHYAYLRVAVHGLPPTREVLLDDALSAYLLDTYHSFLHRMDLGTELVIGSQVVELLAEAKELCLVGAEAARVS